GYMVSCRMRLYSRSSQPAFRSRWHRRMAARVSLPAGRKSLSDAWPGPGGANAGRGTRRSIQVSRFNEFTRIVADEISQRTEAKQQPARRGEIYLRRHEYVADQNRTRPNDYAATRRCKPA